MSPKTVGTLLATVLTFGCAGTGAAPVAGASEGFIPDLRGRQVMVFPVQIRAGVPGDASPEIVFALRARGAVVDWIFPDEFEALLARSPSVDSAVTGLPVGIFLRAQVERIGDPLFGQLRQLGALTGSDIALIPVAVHAGTESAGWCVGRGDRRDHRECAERTGDLVRDRCGQAGLGGRFRVGSLRGGGVGRNVVVVRAVGSDTD